MPERKHPEDAEPRPASDAEAMIRVEREAAERDATETEPGGRYKVGDAFVDADGKPLKG